MKKRTIVFVLAVLLSNAVATGKPNMGITTPTKKVRMLRIVNASGIFKFIQSQYAESHHLVYLGRFTYSRSPVYIFSYIYNKGRATRTLRLYNRCSVYLASHEYKFTVHDTVFMFAPVTPKQYK